MKAAHFATLVLRLMGIYCLIALVPMVQLLNSFILYAQSSSGTMSAPLIAMTILLVGVWLAVGIALIVFSSPLGKRLCPESASEENIANLSFEQVQRLAFAVAGVLIIAETLPQLLNNIFSLFDYWIQAKRTDTPSDQHWLFNRYGIATIIGTFLKAALGLWLFFGAAGFANLWDSLRNFGTPQPPKE